MKNKQEYYFSSDVEADGRVPGLSSMLSFATAVFDIDKNLVGTFSRNLHLLPPPAAAEPSTQEFWAENPEAWEEARRDPVDPADAMRDYVEFVKSFKCSPVFVGYPAVYDFKWFDYYLIRYTGNNPFGFSRAIDMKSYIWAAMKTHRFTMTSKKNFPKRWFDPLPHTHVALDDAIEQGAMAINIFREVQGLPPIDVIKRAV